MLLKAGHMSTLEIVWLDSFSVLTIQNNVHFNKHIMSQSNTTESRQNVTALSPESTPHLV